MRNKLFCLLLFTQYVIISQISITGSVIDESSDTPLPFATIKTSSSSYALSSLDGTFIIHCDSYPVHLTISYIGYYSKDISIYSGDAKKTDVKLTPKTENLETINLDLSGNLATRIIRKAIRLKHINNPKKALQSYSYKSYNKFKITEDNRATLETADTTKADIKKLFNNAHSFLSEKISFHQYSKGVGDKETVLATRMTGFKKPIYNVLGIKIQSNSLYEENYTVFNTKYASPLSNNAINNYYYKVLDTIKGEKPSYVILFQPRKSKKIASLEGILYLDIETLEIQKAIAEIRGELNIMIIHDFEYFQKEKKWIPSHQEVTIKLGYGRQKISLFGGQISIGRLRKNKKEISKGNEYLVSKTDFFDIELNPKLHLKRQLASIEIDSEAVNRSEIYWKKYRTQSITEKDLNSFPIVDSIVTAQNIEQRIEVIQNFNMGYYPLGIINLDLTYPVKYNSYEGFRIGLGTKTTDKLSNHFRLNGYLVYGFRDSKFKYGIGGSLLLNKKKRIWWNFNYSDDLKEVGSSFYLTDRRVYSLFEPRLINIDFYYKHQTWSTSLQYRISPKLLSETQLSISDISQTSGYQYINEGNSSSAYRTAESTIALRWSPFSEFLKTPNKINEIHDGYPKITAQYTQGFKGVLNSNFNYSKFGIKTAYVVNRINQSITSFLLEGNIANGDVPLTHLYHSYPNAPTKETVAKRFSVAGRESFETMYFSEFFSNKLATLHIKHRLRPFKITNWLKPEIVFISRHAIGDVKNIENHSNVDFKSLKHGYQESGLEINKLFAGFGLSFAYRYGAYHLPLLEDNLSFKFTFYLKL